MKKFFRIFLYFIAAIFILFFVFIAFFWISNRQFMESAEEETVAYLKENKVVLDILALEDVGEAALFDAPFYESQVFLLGENHGYADVQQIDKYLLIHLQKKLGLRYYLGEMDSTRADALNEFLGKATKDTMLLKRWVKAIGLRIPQQASQELYQKWMDIYDYNATLPDLAKFIIVGVDKHLDDTSRLIGRDSIMMVNFKSYVNRHKLEQESFYGFFGFTHALQSGISPKKYLSFCSKDQALGSPVCSKDQEHCMF